MQDDLVSSLSLWRGIAGLITTIYVSSGYRSVWSIIGDGFENTWDWRASRWR